MGTGALSLEVKRPGLEADLYLHYLIRLHGVVLS
jgi:hypothetical protein